MNMTGNGTHRVSKDFWNYFNFDRAWVDESQFLTSKYPPGRLYPIYQVGDRVWARETWAYWGSISSDESVIYKADGDKAGVFWKSPIYMFKKHARIWREITEVRIQRIQGISQEDIVDEGIPIYTDTPSKKSLVVYSPLDGIIINQHRRKFVKLWDSINESRGFSWDSNPWVIALTMREIE
jgi:hypothetical protein